MIGMATATAITGVDTYDVAIVGYGPVGQLLSGLLGAAGLQVAVFERRDDLYGLPRACVVDDEVMRILQADGVAEEFEAAAVNTQGEYVWTNAQGQVLLRLKRPAQGISGWGARYMMYQPDLEKLLDTRARSFPNVHMSVGWSAVGVCAGDEDVTLELERVAPSSEGNSQKRVRARYLVGADGANSFVRQAAQLPWMDLGFRADWVVIDFRPFDPDLVIDMPMTGQICDPARPTSLFRRLGKRHVRWEMMLLPGETPEQITRSERIWELLSRWVTPQQGIIERRAVYTFKSGVAAGWRRGRILLAGDAAHLMPPFLGQGMCSGMRDAMALAWRLAALRGSESLASRLLESYGAERRAHVEGVIARSVALGKIVCITDPEQAAERDRQFSGGEPPPLPPFPKLTTGLLYGAGGLASDAAGELCIQARVALAGQSGRFDDLVGRGWYVLSFDRELALEPRHRNFLRVIGARCVTITSTPNCGLFDVDGNYRKFFEQLRASVLVVRPDFYLFGATSTVEHLPALLDDLMAQIKGADNVHFLEVSSA
jgi:2-polyprenyl-6-methoxyphenol hydroxylase-like FAD-dependent oxidoreductase